MGLPPLIRARDAVRPTPVEVSNPILQTRALCAPCALGFVKSAGSPPHGADLFTSRPSCTQVIDAYAGRLLASPAVKVHEVKGVSSAAAAGALQAPGLAWRGCRSFVRPTSVLMPRAGANGARQRPSERACPAQAFSGPPAVADPHILGALSRMLYSTVSHAYVTGDLCYVQWSFQPFPYSWLC